MTKCLFVGGPLDGQERFERPPRPVDFRATEPDEGGASLKWSYNCHLFSVGPASFPVYVVNGLNMELAREKVLTAMSSRT